MLDQEMVKRLDKMEEILTKSASRPSGAGRALGGFTQDWRSNEWPEKQLERLAPYGQTALSMVKGGMTGRASRLSGVGPYLCKMAGMAAMAVNHTGTINLLKGQGLWEDGYGAEKFCKQFDASPAGMPIVTKGWNGAEVRKAALAENSGQTGGYTIPPQFMNELLTIGAEDAFIEPRAKVVPMTSRTVQWPMLDITAVQASGTTPYFGGILASWQPEAATISETEPAFKQSEWTAWDLVMYTVSSNQLLADNGIGLDALLTQMFGEANTWYKEFAFLQGKGAGSTMPLGILNAAATLAVTRTVANRFTLADAAGMLSHLQIRSWDDACWVMHQSVIPQLIQMASGAVANTASSTYIPGNQLVWTNPNGGNGILGPMAQKLPQAFLNGLPIFFTEKVPQLGTAGDVMLIDFSKYVIGTRLDLQVDVSPHFLFRTNQLAWRVISRCDGRPWLNSYITDQSGWQVSPFVKLS